MKKALALTFASLSVLVVTAAPASAAQQAPSQPTKLCRIFPIFCM